MCWTRARVSPSVSRMEIILSQGLWMVDIPSGVIANHSLTESLSMASAVESVIAQTSLCVGASGGSSVSIYEQSWASMDGIVLFILSQEGDVEITKMG